MIDSAWLYLFPPFELHVPCFTSSSLLTSVVSLSTLTTAHTSNVASISFSLECEIPRAQQV